MLTMEASWKPRVVLFVSFLSMMVLRAAEECVIPPKLVEKLDLDVEMRMEAVAHIAAVMAQQMNCKVLGASGSLCLSDKELVRKFMLLQEWASEDQGWDRIFSAYLLYHDAIRFMGTNKSTFASASLEQAVAFRLFPYSDSNLLEHWHRALAMPGKLFSKQRLDLADILLLSADSQLEDAQGTQDLSTLERALQSLELSLGLREAEDDPDTTIISEGYAKSLRAEIARSAYDIVPKLDELELQALLAERGLTCHECVGKTDLLKKLVPLLRLPIKLGSKNAVIPDVSAPRQWISRRSGEDNLSYLHRILSEIVGWLEESLLQEADVPCTKPSASGCQSFAPLWDAITSPLQRHQNHTRCIQSGGLQSASQESVKGSRTWRLLDHLRIKEPQAVRQNSNATGEVDVGGADEPLAAMTSAAAWLELGLLQLPPCGQPITTPGVKGICHHIGAFSACEDGSCMDVCGLLDGMMELESPDFGSTISILHKGVSLQSVVDSLPLLARSPHSNNWSGSFRTGRRNDVSEPGSENAHHGHNFGPSSNLGGFGTAGSSDEAFRSERDRKLQEQLNRRHKENSGEYQDDPLVLLMLCVCVISIVGMYLGRKHRRSLSRILCSWFAIRGNQNTSAPTLGTSISKERQAAAAALRAALAKPDVSVAELSRCLEAAEATDVEGPLVRRGNQTLLQRKRRERDLAESARSKAKAAKNKEVTRVKKGQARQRETHSADTQRTKSEGTEDLPPTNGNAATTPSRHCSSDDSPRKNESSHGLSEYIDKDDDGYMDRTDKTYDRHDSASSSTGKVSRISSSSSLHVADSATSQDISDLTDGQYADEKNAQELEPYLPKTPDSHGNRVSRNPNDAVSNGLHDLRAASSPGISLWQAPDEPVSPVAERQTSAALASLLPSVVPEPKPQPAVTAPPATRSVSDLPSRAAGTYTATSSGRKDISRQPAASVPKPAGRNMPVTYQRLAGRSAASGFAAPGAKWNEVAAADPASRGRGQGGQASAPQQFSHSHSLPHSQAVSAGAMPNDHLPAAGIDFSNDLPSALHQLDGAFGGYGSAGVLASQLRNDPQPLQELFASELGLHYLNTLSQQELPQTLPSEPDIPLPAYSEVPPPASGTRFPASLAAIWGDTFTPEARTGSMPTATPGLGFSDAPGFQAFGRNSIWGLSTARIPPSSDLPVDMDLSSLAWPFQPLTGVGHQPNDDRPPTDWPL